jgi:flagellar FliL protein
MSEEKAESAAPAAKAPSQMKLVIVGAVALFVAVLGAQVAAPIVNNMIGGGASAAAPTPVSEHAEEAKAAADADHDDEPQAPAQYIALDPPFVVSFDEEDGARYLQLQVQAMARDAETIAAVKQHNPAVRNALLFLLSGYELEAITTQAGKEELRQAMLKSTNEILKKNRVATPVEDLYFTSLVVQ